MVVPTPKPLRLEDVGLGFADGAFNYAKAKWSQEGRGEEIGAGVRVQRIAFSLCAEKPVRLEGRIALTALPQGDGDPALRVPDRPDLQGRRLLE
ncbi:MAG: GerW family sporulation protein, partial [Actinobacteria bacterium]|nr:GerW family sporulation protein [Actinomycetota bacterium]